MVAFGKLTCTNNVTAAKKMEQNLLCKPLHVCVN